MRHFVKIAAVLLLAAFFQPQAKAQNPEYDVFVPICKYMVKGEADALSAWFDDYLEVSVVSEGRNASKTQARQIMRTFFEQYTPSGFKITHTATQGEMKYALGNLEAGGRVFSVTIFVIYKDNRYKVQQLKIER